MKCEIFFGEWFDAKYGFNRWARGKALTKDVIIHEHIYHYDMSDGSIRVIIIVYYPEGSQFDIEE